MQYALLFYTSQNVVDSGEELPGCASTVEVWAEGRLVAEHLRHTRRTDGERLDAASLAPWLEAGTCGTPASVYQRIT